MATKRIAGRKAASKRGSKRARRRWTKISGPDAQELVRGTLTPGTVFPVPVSGVPSQLRRLPGATAYYVSSYVTASSIGSGLTAGGEITVLRAEGTVGKAYNYVIASSTDGNVYFQGPFKHFSDHHFDPCGGVDISKLFGHHRFP
jgi:hypothetical protein